MDTFLLIGICAVVVILIRNNLARRKIRANGGKNAILLNEAEVYLAYGRKKQAQEILEKCLLENPGDPDAISLLNKINQ